MSLNYEKLLGSEAKSLLEHKAVIAKESLTLPSADWVSQILAHSDRSPRVLRSMQSLYTTGRLANSGYVSIFPVDQGIEHSAGASFAPNPLFFDPENIVKFAIESGCSGVASTLGVLGIAARKYAHKIPFVLKLNHNEFLSLPNKYDQSMFASVKQAADMGAVAVGATVYFGAPESARQIREVSEAFAAAHDLGLTTILWCYTRNNGFKVDGVDYHNSADLTGQADRLDDELKQIPSVGRTRKPGAIGEVVHLLFSPDTLAQHGLSIFRVLESLKQRNDDASSILSREWKRLVYGPGHFEASEPTDKTVAAIDRDLAAHPGLFVTGSGFRGLGIPDCVADARATAKHAVAALAAVPA